jgi:phenylalanyl-tRNA synthetase beta subunit
MLDKLMIKIGLKFNNENDIMKSYTIKPSCDKIFFEDRQAEIYIQNGIKIGIFGIVNPVVLKNFGIKNPVSICEIDLQLVFDMIMKGDLLEGFY